MFRPKTSKKTFIIANPRDRTHPLDNAIRISGKKYSLDPKKQYVISIKPDQESLGLAAKYDNILYPLIIDDTVEPDTLLPTDNIRRYLGHSLNQKVPAEIVEITDKNMQHTNECNFFIVKLSPSYADSVEIPEVELNNIIRSTLSDRYLFSIGQSICVEYKADYRTYKIELQITAIKPVTSKSDIHCFSVSDSTKLTFSITPAIRNLKITTEPPYKQDNKKSFVNISQHETITKERQTINPIQLSDEDPLPPIQSLDNLFNNKEQDKEISQLPNNLSLDFKKMGVGGLDKELQELVTHVFYPRALGKLASEAYGVKPVKGVLLYGPPGTGKTLIARSIASLFSASKVEVVRGPELKSKYVGESQRKLREIFANAELDALIGNQQNLYVIIFDEMDSLFPKRGTRTGSTGVDDDMTSQILSILDGVDTLNNVLVIGTTNRKDLLDDALLRENRFALSLEIGLPERQARKEILEIQTKELREANLLTADVDLNFWADKTRNYSGADIQKLVRTAKDYAQRRNFTHDIGNNTLQLKGEITSVNQLEKVNTDDFVRAFKEIKPTNGIDKQEFNFDKNKFVIYNNALNNIIKRFDEYLMQPTKQFSLLLYGKPGTGKTELAKYLATHADLACIKLITPTSLIGKSNAEQLHTVENTFYDARRAESSIIILDNLEGILGYDPTHLRYNNDMRLMLIDLLGDNKSKNKCMVIATCATRHFVIHTELDDCFQEVAQLDPATLSLPQHLDNIKLLAASLGLTLTLDRVNFPHDIALPIKRLAYMMKKCAHNHTLALSDLCEATSLSMTKMTETPMNKLSTVSIFSGAEVINQTPGQTTKNITLGLKN